MLWTKTLIYSIYLLLFNYNNGHPIYISSTEIAYKEKAKSIEITVKIFSDDLEKVLSDQLKKKIEIGTDREDSKTDEYISEYLNKHFHIHADNKKLNYKLIGRENGSKSDMFAMYLYLEVKNIKPFKNLQVENSILIDEFYNQLNFISCHTKSSGLLKVISRKGNLKHTIRW